MASFEDTTGWYEELLEWQNSEEYKSRTIEDGIVDPTKMMTRDSVIPLAELMLKDKECRSFLQEIVDWEQKYLDKEHDENTPQYPGEASRNLLFFISWFLYKSGIKFRNSRFDAPILSMCKLILKGEIEMDDHASMNLYLDMQEERLEALRRQFRDPKKSD